MVGAIIVGGGKSNRFGEDKISFLIDNKPLIYYTTIPFVKSDLIDEIVVVLSKENYERIKVYFRDIKKIKEIVIGGNERKHSVINGLKPFLNSNINKILIHDGARPNVKLELIEKIIRKIEEDKCVIPVIPVKETIKISEGNNIKTLDRDSLLLTQTPQGFPFPLIYNLLKKYEDKKLFDDSMVFELEGKKIETIQGDPLNIKITYNSDIYQAIDFIKKNEDRYRI